MKKTFSVNLGNRVFNIDEDAYLRLKGYLDRIESYFSDQKEREDIINDIELRLSELFAERLSVSKQVITMADVLEAIHIMGDPGEIAGGNKTSENEKSYRPYEASGSGRRLFRDPDQRVLGGVCSGLSYYLDVDPVILRVIFIVLFLVGGFGGLIYLVMWIVVPKAVTTADKLQMRGEPINASNIGNFFKEEFDSVKRSFRNKRSTNQ